MRNRPLPKENLARNLRLLMDASDLSEERLAKKAGVAQKTINKMLNQTSEATLGTVEKIAAAFGATSWQLIMPDLPLELLSSAKLERLYDHYIKSSREGRDYIDHVAERESQYHPQAGNEK